MAKEDDLSVNIGVGLDIDSASFDEVNQAINKTRENLDSLLSSRKDKQKDFITEIKKQLGFGSDVEIQVGGYSIKEPLKKAQQKAGKGFEKIAGGAFDGATIADKAEVAIARALNEAGKELTKRFNINFVDDFAESMKDISFKKNTKSEISAAKEYIKNSVDPKDAEKISQMLGLEASNVLSKAISKTDFVIPGDEDALASLSTQIENGVEDFVVNALGSVTISPAMFIAAADRALQNQPNVKTNSETGMSIGDWTRPYRNAGVVSDPTPIFNGRSALEATPDQISRFDKIASEKEAQVGGERLAAAFTYAVGKDLDEIVIGAWEKASKEVASNKDIEKILKEDPTFSISGIAASDAFANLEIYIMDRFIENVKEGELGKGYQPGSFASNLNSIKSASRGETILDFPDDPMNVLPKDKVLNWLNTMIQDGVMHPLQQIFENPGILGKAFVSNSESAMKGGFTRLIKESSGETTLSKNAQVEKQYNNQLMAQTKELMDAAKWLDSRVTNVAKELENFQKGNIPQISKSADGKKEAQDFAKDFYNAMRGGEFDSFKGELKSNLQDYEKEQNRLKDIKRFGPMETTETLAQTRGGGALNPDIELLRKYLSEQKALVEAKGETFMAALDTEFNSKIDEKLTELGMVIKDGTGKFVEIFKFLQLPGDPAAMYAGSAHHPPGSARTPADLTKRAQLLGIPKENIGVPNDSEANFLQYREKISKLVDILNLLSNLGVSLTGSNFQSAEASNIKKAIEYINSTSKEMGLDPLATPDLKNVFDPAALAKKLSPASSELTKIFDSPEAKAGISGALGNLIKNISQQFPEFISRYSDQFKMSDNGNTFQYKAAGGPAQAHYALTDAAASLIVKDFVEEFGGMAATMLVPVAKDLNTKVQAAAGGSGGGKGPNTPLASGDKPEDNPYANRAADSIQQLLLVGQKYDSAVKGLTKAEIVKVEQRLAILQKSSEQAELLANLAELEKKRSDILAEAAQLIAQSSKFGRGRIAVGDASRQGPLTEGDAAAAKRYQQQTIEATRLGTAIAELTIAGQKNERQVIETVKSQSRQNVVSEQLTENMRKEIDANIANAQAGKSATSQIKAQMQEQVNAQKAVQKQTQSLMNTWVTSRYALYDIGNFYTSVAQNLIRVSRQVFDTTQSYRNFETSFTSVERAMQLTGSAAVDLRDQFIKLSEQFPISFEEISRIATLGAQMGIAADGVVQFTQTVAKFSTITGISADTVAQKFGKIAELADVDPTQFENLGSAVAFAGINAVATESEILTLSESIAAVANQSGITAPEIIGIATALASVGVPAEQARGVFTRVFADLDRAASVGGESLANLASVAGMSAEEFAGSWGKEGEANNVFIALLEGLNASDNLTETFDKLNIVETREINTLTRLAKNLDVVRQALGDSNSSFADATFLGESFGKTADNLDAKIIIFKNNVDALAAAFSSGIAERLKDFLDLGSDVLKFLKGASQSFLFLNAALPLLGILGAGVVLTGFLGILAKVTAQVYAFRVAMVNAANDPTAVTGFGRQLKQLLGLGSGMIELRDKVSGINEKGLIEPVNYSGFIANEKKQQEELLRTRNIYLANGEVMKDTAAASAAGAKTSMQLARLEANAVQDAINKQVNAIKREELALDQLVITQKTATGADKDLIASKIADQTATIELMKNKQLYTTIHAGQVKIIDADTLATYKNVAASKASATAEREEAAARAASATQINLQTTTAASTTTSMLSKVGSAISRFIGVAGIILTVVTAIDMLYNAFVDLNKVDLTLSGGGVESLREAIKKDTQAVKEGTMEAVGTVTVGYKEVSEASDKAAIAINTLTGTQSLAEKSMRNATEATKEQTLSIGENTKVWIANAIAKDESLNKIDWTATKQTMDDLGMDFDSLLRDIAAKASGVNIDPFKSVSDRLKEIAVEANNIAKFDPKFQTNPRIKELEKERSALIKLRDDLSAIGPAFEKGFNEIAKIEAVNAAFGVSTNAILDLSDALAEATSSGTGMEDVLLQVQNAVIEVAGITSKGDLLKIRTSSSIKALLDVIKTMYEAAKASDKLRGVSVSDLQRDRAMAARGGATEAQLKALDNQIKQVRAGTSAAGDSAEALKNALTSIESILAGSGSDGSSSGPGSLEEKIKTLTDYANDLRSVLQSAFDIRYQKQVGLDAITSSWITLTKSAEDAKKAIKSANDEINQSTADKAVLQYQLSVAERYNDEKRAAVIRAKLSKLDAEIITQQEQLAEANDANNKTLSGNSKAAIENRSKVRDLVTQYNSYLVALANSGMSSDQLKTQAAALEQEFLNQGEALGFSRGELAEYTSAFSNDFTTVINNLPREITLDVNTSPAMRSIDEFVAKAKTALSTVGGGSVPGSSVLPTQTLAERVQLIKDNLNNPSILEELKKRTGTRGGEYFIYMRAIANYLKNITRPDADSLLALIGLSRGGFVSGPGTSTSDSIPAMLSKGEYVVRASSVGAYGLDFMNALNQQRVGFEPASQSMALQSSTGSSVVYLSPEDRALLRAAVDRPIALYTENSKIAQSANAGNVLLAQRGSN